MNKTILKSKNILKGKLLVSIHIFMAIFRVFTFNMFLDFKIALFICIVYSVYYLLLVDHYRSKNTKKLLLLMVFPV